MGNSSGTGVSNNTDVSQAQHLATLRIVYPPPPITIVGIPKLFTNLTQSPCPLKKKKAKKKKTIARFENKLQFDQKKYVNIPFNESNKQNK